MSRRSGPEIDDEQTSIYDSSQRSKKDTKRGHDGSARNTSRAKDDSRRSSSTGKTESPAEKQLREDREREEFRRRSIEMATPTVITPDAPVPVAVSARAGSEPIRVISMKTPHVDDIERQELEAKAHVVKLRAISDVSAPINARMGRLAPPRDARGARVRRLRDFVIWGCAVVIISCLVMLAIWFLARR